jgi:phosphatidylserine/phosphatidylglycerophosphate/cardiolipin synthase-like enzyme
MKLFFAGSPHHQQAIHNHQHVSASEYSSGKVCLPSPAEIPNIDLEVINFHRPTFGTFHSKFMVVDRKFGCISSNNIQVGNNPF